MALCGVFNSSALEINNHAIFTYNFRLRSFTKYIAQLSMESNGKSVDRNGVTIAYQTGSVVWGNTGTNAQHAFIQLLHQGTILIPTDFILCETSLHGKKNHQDILMANCSAQTEALLMGTYGEDVSNPYKVFQGNKPSNLLKINKLSPESLGALIAMYEHKIFVQGAVLNIYSYDQFGVELGKKMANKHLEG